MGIRSTSNIQTFIDDFYRSGTDASLSAPDTASASGGVKIESGGYVYHIFMGGTGPNYAGNPISEETFTINSGTITDAEILVVGGGGGGKNDGGGGGGAGAVYHATDVPLPSSPIPITIGERGTGNTTNNGGDTTFGPVTAQGGGYGNDGSAGGPGGSGGGGGGPGTPSGGTSTASPVSAFGVTFTAYGNTGGNNPHSNDGGSGGGGALNAGSNRPPTAGGAGGAGKSFPAFPGPVISPALPTTARPNVDPNYGGTAWPSATTNPVALNSAWQTATGPTGLFGGGGGGGAYFPVTTRAEGGPGGGGSGASSGSNGPGPGYAFPGLDYTGGGGGAATSSSAQSPGRPGGRGVVIIKYS